MKFFRPPFEKMSAEEIDHLVRLKWLAYNDLQMSIQVLLFEEKTIYWLERRLLKLVRWFALARIKQLASGVPTLDINGKEARLDKSNAEALAEAEAGNHKLGQWASANGGWRAICQVCGKSTWLSLEGLRYSWLDEPCTGHKPSWNTFVRERLTTKLNREGSVT